MSWEIWGSCDDQEVKQENSLCKSPASNNSDGGEALGRGQDFVKTEMDYEEI